MGGYHIVVVGTDASESSLRAIDPRARSPLTRTVRCTDHPMTAQCNGAARTATITCDHRAGELGNGLANLSKPGGPRFRR